MGVHPGLWDPRKAFERGDLQEIIQRFSAKGPVLSSEAGAFVCALASVGRWAEAEALALESLERLDAEDVLRVRFVLAVEATRTSRFSSALRWIRAQRDDKRGGSSPELSQAVAFHFYYRGQFSRAIIWARRALRRALKVGNSYIHLLALEMLGHALVQTGRWQSGLHLLREVRQLAHHREFVELAETVEAAILRYEAESGFRAAQVVLELRRKIETIASEDIYSRSNLVLELARQLIYRGRWSEARQLLDREAPRIYSLEERRIETLLQLRLAELADLMGDEPALVHFLRSARRCLVRVADRHFELRILIAEVQWQTRYQGRVSSETRERILALSRDFPSLRNDRLLAFEGLIPPVAAAHGEDPFFDLLEETKRTPERGLEKILESGYLGLWPRLKGLPPGKEALIVRRDHRILWVSREGVNLSNEPWPSLPLRLLRRLAQSGAGKEELIQDVWKLAYDPLRHDSLIYSGLATVRRLLGEVGDWIQNSDTGWTLKGEVLWMDEASSVPSPSLLRRREELIPDLEGLNFRQIQALRQLPARESWDIRSYQAVFSVSHMTAWRDLDALFRSGFLRRVGRGRATRYLPPKN